MHPSDEELVGRTLPFSADAESEVIGACLVEGSDTYARCLDTGLTDQSFYAPANRALFKAMGTLAKRGDQIDLSILTQELIDRGTLETIGGMEYLMEVTRKVPTTARASFFIERVRQDAGKRELIRRGSELVEHAYNGSDLGDLVTDGKTWIDQMANGIATPRKNERLKQLEARRITVVSAPQEPTTRLFLAGKPICTPGNITTLISRAKTGKTATIGGAIAAIIAAHHDRSGLDTLGFSAPHTKEAVVLIDTEQSPYDAFICHQRALSRAAQDKDMDWLCHYALVGYQVQEIKDSIIAALDQAVNLHKGVFMLIIDGVADLVSSVNDEAECNQVVAWIRSISVKYNTPVICVIHSNEGAKTGDDGRGHLGKQLTRKAESNLLLKKTGEVTVITSEKQRKAPITESDGVAFQWSDEHGRHVSCGKPEIVKKNGRPSTYHFDQFHTIFQRVGRKGLTFQAAYRFAETDCGISEMSFRRLLASSVQNGELEKFIESGATNFRLANLPLV